MPPGTAPLPADDPDLRSLTLDELELRWSEAASRTAISAESMMGADRKAQALGIPGGQLMEHAGTAVAAAARALLEHNAREGRPILVLAGPGNNGGDGFVAARHLAEWGYPVIAVLVAPDEKPRTRDAAHNWKRLDGIDGVTKIHVPVARDLAILGQGIEKAGIIVDALLGTGVHGRLREPVLSAVQMIRRARDAGTPVLAVDTPTADRPHLGRSVRPGRARRPDHHLPPSRRPACRPASARRWPGASWSRRSGSRRRPTVAEGERPPVRADVERQPGLREVLLVAAAIVLIVLVAAGATALLPSEGQAVVFHSPLLIVVLLAGTAIVLWRILRSPHT